MNSTLFDPTDIRGNLEEIRYLQKKQQHPEIKVNVIWGGSPKTKHKWNLFIGHYLSNGMDRKKAAIGAGYSAHSAQNQGTYLLSIPVIKKEIARVIEKKLNYLEVTFEWKMDLLKNVIQKCADGEQVNIGIVQEINTSIGDKTKVYYTISNINIPELESYWIEENLIFNTEEEASQHINKEREELLTDFINNPALPFDM